MHDLRYRLAPRSDAARGASLIEVDGGWWGTAREISDHLGNGVTASMVRRWGERDGLPRIRITDASGRPQVRYLLCQASRLESKKRRGHRGRPRATSV